MLEHSKKYKMKGVSIGDDQSDKDSCDSREMMSINKVDDYDMQKTLEMESSVQGSQIIKNEAVINAFILKDLSGLSIDIESIEECFEKLPDPMES
jgi:hypothetical protein